MQNAGENRDGVQAGEGKEPGVRRETFRRD